MAIDQPWFQPRFSIVDYRQFYFLDKISFLIVSQLTGRLAQLVERRTREQNVSGLYRCGFESPAGQLKLLIVFRMRR